MVARRTLVVFNFSVAVLFVGVALLSLYAASVLRPGIGQVNVPPAFNARVLQSLSEEKDVEKLRSQAVFYYELAREQRRARHASTEDFFHDVRLLAFFVAGLFAMGGLLVMLPPKTS